MLRSGREYDQSDQLYNIFILYLVPGRNYELWLAPDSFYDQAAPLCSRSPRRNINRVRLDSIDNRQQLLALPNVVRPYRHRHRQTTCKQTSRRRTDRCMICTAVLLLLLLCCRFVYIKLQLVSILSWLELAVSKCSCICTQNWTLFAPSVLSIPSAGPFGRAACSPVCDLKSPLVSVAVASLSMIPIKGASQ